MTKSSKNNMNGLQILFTLVLLIGSLLGLVAFILNFTNKKSCSEGYDTTGADNGDESNKWPPFANKLYKIVKKQKDRNKTDLKRSAKEVLKALERANRGQPTIPDALKSDLDSSNYKNLGKLLKEYGFKEIKKYLKRYDSNLDPRCYERNWLCDGGQKRINVCGQDQADCCCKDAGGCGCVPNPYIGTFGWQHCPLNTSQRNAPSDGSPACYRSSTKDEWLKNCTKGCGCAWTRESGPSKNVSCKNLDNYAAIGANACQDPEGNTHDDWCSSDYCSGPWSWSILHPDPYVCYPK